MGDLKRPVKEILTAANLMFSEELQPASPDRPFASQTLGSMGSGPAHAAQGMSRGGHRAGGARPAFGGPPAPQHSYRTMRWLQA